VAPAGADASAGALHCAHPVHLAGCSPTLVAAGWSVGVVDAHRWDGKKLRIPLEDDAIVTTRGVEWLYPVNQKVLLIR
jgi:hypothetical protein